MLADRMCTLETFGRQATAQDPARDQTIRPPAGEHKCCNAENTMGSTTHSIDVNAPLRAVYNQWTQFEEFPRFMEGVVEIRQQGPRTLFWKVNVGGKDKQWEAEILEQVPDTRIIWESVDGTQNRGMIAFEPVDHERTRITLTIEYEPEGFLERAGDALGIPSSQVEGDLKRFRDFIEKRETETGRWRGRSKMGKASTPPVESVDRKVLWT